MQNLKEQLCEVCRNMWQLGWVAANDGNVSVKVEENVFLITPSGVSKGKMTPEMLILVDGAGQKLEGAPQYHPSSEMAMHLRCYELRPDVHAVLHAHPPASTAFAVANRPMDEYCMIETVLSMGSVPVAPYATPSTPEVPDSITPFLPMHDAILLSNHGALTVGSDLWKAYYRMESLEMYAKTLLNAYVLGGPRELPKERIEELITLRTERYHMDGRHPGYKKYH